MGDSENSPPSTSTPAVVAPVRSPLPRWTVPVVAVLVLSVTTLVSVLLWRWVDGLAFADTDKKSAAHLDVLKLAASIAVGGGGLFALYLAARRQRTQELELEERHRLAPIGLFLREVRTSADTEVVGRSILKVSVTESGGRVVMGIDNRISRVVGCAGTVAVMVLTGSVVGATPAVAGVNCDRGYHCLFYSDVNSSKHQYFDSVNNFDGNTFSGGNEDGAGQLVDNNSWAASNSSTGNRESHYYDLANHSVFLFCVNPGATVHSLPSGLSDKASSLRLRPRTSTRCLSN